VTVKGGSDITMRDDVTSLWWSNKRGTTNWYGAEAACANLSYNGKSDWRLPTLEDFKVAHSHQIYSKFKTGWLDMFDMSLYYYWSGSTVDDASDDVWFVLLKDGTTYDYGDKSVHGFQVVCVRP
jgi:hypothetical protein